MRGQVYGALWWQIVYAAQPSYRAAREDLVNRATLAEREAERAAVLDCHRRGLLVLDMDLDDEVSAK